MNQAMEFGKIKMFLNSKINKDFFVIMKCGQAIVQVTDHMSCMTLILGKEQKVEEHVHSFDHM
jgi:predicted transcriptional regulator